MVSYSQTELYVSIGGSTYKKMSNMHLSGITDTIFVSNTSDILTFSISSSNGDQLTLNKQPGLNTVDTYTIGIKNTATVTAQPNQYSIYWTQGQSGNTFKFIVKYKPLSISSSIVGNAVSFGVDTLNRLNYKINNTIVHGIWEYKFDQSPSMPSSGTLSMYPNIPLQSYSASGVYYFHVRAWNFNTDPNENEYGFSFTSWNTYSVQVTYTTSTVGISEQNAIENLKVYPNPASTEITVSYASETNIEKVSVYNIGGQEVSSIAVESSGENKVSFNVESYSPGIYFVRIGTATYKFIKQ